MNDQRNLVLAVVLSAIVLFGWAFIQERYFPTANPPATEFVDGQQVPVERPDAGPASAAPPAAQARAEAIGASPRVRIETPSLRGSLNLRGARIDDLVLTRHSRTLADDSPPVRLFSPAGAPDSYYGSFGWMGTGLAAPGPDTVWTADGDTLAPGRPVTLAWNNGQGQLFQIRLEIDDGYMFTAHQRVTNAGAGPIAAQPFALVNRIGESPDPTMWTLHVGPVGVFNGAANYSYDFADLAGGAEPRFSTTGGWLGFGDKYWLAAVIPAQDGGADAAFRHDRATNAFQADFMAAPAIVQPGAAHVYTSRMFAGAKEFALLETYTDRLGIQRFDKAIDWGWFEWFMKPIFRLLNWLFAAIGNFGVAIICLTLIVRLILFPLAQKQFASMAAMRVLQPKMKAIQDRYKDDKPRMQQEMLKLYREEKVNPMAGCLPILLQIPIFYALYKVLMLAVEMRHEPFALWIQDLSAPDPLTPVNLFGFLPFTPPAFLAIGILPILLGITMWLQFKLNPAPMDPIQKQVFGIMPWVLMVIMAPFAAGLQLYWVVNNVLTIAQQKWLYSRHPVLKQQAAAEAAKKPDGDAPPPAAPDPAPAAAPAPAARGRAKKPRSRR
ncbi:MAG: membrane protein insertase YidC [Allosphingosinicella sp.]|uniref:membrane protein insertase YidC n=1 Tax=Allosphingosinicella sp. TaxID=2823234 RepID=UPI00395DA2F2